MFGTSKGIKAEFKTKDLSEGAFIMHFLGKPKFITDGRVVFFVWDEAQKAKDLSQSYWMNKEIPALQFATAHKRLKGWLMEQNGEKESVHNREWNNR